MIEQPPDFPGAFLLDNVCFLILIAVFLIKNIKYFVTYFYT